MFINLFIKFLFIIIVTLKLTSCGSGDTRKLTTEEIIYNPKDKSRLGQMQKGGDFLSGIIGGNKNKEGNGSFGVVSIKSPLWKASLDVLSSFPLSNVDSRSGLIITDWYTSEKKPSERFKITVLLLSQNISAESVKVSIHRQIIRQNRWVNKNIDSKKPIAIERKIIQRAIELNL